MNKKWSDEDLQRMLDGDTAGTNADVPAAAEKDLAAYQLLFDALKQEPAGGLPYDFSAKLVRKISAEKNRPGDIGFYAWAAVLGALALGLTWVALSFINKDNAAQFATMVLKFKWALVFIAGAFLTVQYFDQKLVKEV